MAYINQEHKKRIAAELKQVIPAGWKWSLGIRHHSTIVLTISAGPAELAIRKGEPVDHWTPNHYYIDTEFTGELGETFKRIVRALNLDNYDRSDPMTDYFAVGHYVIIYIGRWDKPYQVKEA